MDVAVAHAMKAKTMDEKDFQRILNTADRVLHNILNMSTKQLASVVQSLESGKTQDALDAAK